MERKVNYNYEFKLRCVEEVLKKNRSVVLIASKNGLQKSNLKKWISFYHHYGKEGLLPKRNQKCTAVFKEKVLQTLKRSVYL